MDDPWGSPWTAGDDAPPPPKIDVLPAPPPSAHFSASADHSPQQRAVSPARSPWDDDDAWGGWSSEQPGKDKDGSSSNNNNNSPRWGRSPGLRPQDAVGGSGPASRLPSPSPDSWGQLAMLETARMKKDKNVDSAISLGEGAATLRRDVSRDRYLGPTSMFNDNTTNEESAEDVWRKPRPSPSTESFGTPVSAEEEPRAGSPVQPPGPAIHIDAQAKTSRQPSLKVQELVSMYDGIAKRSNSVSPIDPSLRNASGAASPLEGHVGDPVESEPEPLDLGPVMDPRDDVKPDLEVTETPLVGGPLPGEDRLPTNIFRSVEEALPVENLLPASDPPPAEEPLHVEDLRPASDPLPVEQPLPVAAALPVVEPFPEAKFPHSESPVEMSKAAQDLVSGKEQQEAQFQPPIFQNTHHETLEQTVHTTPKPPSTPYAINLTNLDKLFPSVDTSFPPPEPVPDVIIDDTFASIDERKTWYRISRPGSIRKHKLGDDENYVRISWGTSTLRDEGIRIVRRWMEEDSIAGRVVLGRRAGGAASGRIFNWDSSARQTEFSISELLSRNSHSRHASNNSKTTVASPTTPAFGWSNGSASLTVAIPPPETHVAPITQPSPQKKSLPAPVVPVLQPIGRPSSIVQPIASPTSPLAQPSVIAESNHSRPAKVEDIKNTNGQVEGSDDDDDWGEMVSSPMKGSNETLPSLAAIVETEPAVNGAGISRPASIAQASDEFVGSRLKQTMSTAAWTDVPRSSFDAPFSQGLIPASQSKSSTTSRTDVNRFSIDIPASQGFLPPSHSKSSRTSWTSLTRSSMDGAQSEELIPHNVRPPLPKDQSRPSSWAFGNVDFRNGAPNPARPIKDLPPSTRKALTLFSNPSDAPDLDLPPDHSTAVAASRSSPESQTPQINPSANEDDDDETVAKILRDLPDLSYMLR
ncbi:hypothetical protein B0J13DRAFT_547709 [Dactylonectria estremocensis]|uniref:Uncharacterized protein n=1 Tax=Dactylonectria estremocensis TaxID=1079267 RepID=A0A9P9F4Q0_9HYPO|nr:hypothetical protein B0J13DRAFT_547709 [Dactylonectria estremocensis]